MMAALCEETAFSSTQPSLYPKYCCLRTVFPVCVPINGAIADLEVLYNLSYLIYRNKDSLFHQITLALTSSSHSSIPRVTLHKTLNLLISRD